MAAKWTSKPPEVLRHWLVSLQEPAIRAKLTPWEETFLVSVDRAFHQDGGLSQRRQEVLETIYANRTS